jgi:hypothetical protein
MRFSVVSVSGEHGMEWDGTGRMAERDGRQIARSYIEFETAVLGDCGERLIDNEPGGDDRVGVAMKSISGGMWGGKMRGGVEGSVACVYGKSPWDSTSKAY